MFKEEALKAEEILESDVAGSDIWEILLKIQRTSSQSQQEIYQMLGLYMDAFDKGKLKDCGKNVKNKRRCVVKKKR